MERILKCPWDEINGEPRIEKEENSWVIKYLSDKDVPLSYTNKPEKEEQIVKIARYLFGSRNFILLVSNDSAYIKSIYYWLAAIWVMETETGFEICDPAKINSFDNDYKEVLSRLEHASLLMIPYTDPSDYSLRRIKNALGGILAKRKAANRPTITDVFSKKEINNKEIANLVGSLSPVFGEQCVPMFLTENTNSKIIKV